MPTTMQALPPPRDYAELVSAGWTVYIGNVARVRGIPPQEIEDFVGDVTLYIIEHDALASFDPDRAAWSTYLRGYVVKRSQSWLRDRARQLRELCLNAPVRASLDEGEDITVEDTVGAPDEMMDYILSNTSLSAFEGWLDEVGDGDLADLYASLLWNVLQAPLVDGSQTRFDMAGYTRLRYRLAADLGVRKFTVDRMISRLKARAAEYGLLEGV